jgi:hypothetical protein
VAYYENGDQLNKHAFIEDDDYNKEISNGYNIDS